jgi:hypothetical protein
MQYEYTVLDHGFTGTGLHVDTVLNDMASKGWRLVAAVQRVNNGSNCIRHYLEREKCLDKSPLSAVS